MPVGTNIDGPNGATSPAWQLMHWFDVTNSCDLSRLPTTQSWVTGGRWATRDRSPGLIEAKKSRNRGSARRTGRGAASGRAHVGCGPWSVPPAFFLASSRHESSTRNRIGSPGKPAMLRSEMKVNSLASDAGSVFGEWVAAWQRTQ